MRDLTTLRIDLGINAQQIASQIMIDNKNLERQIQKGIQLALDEIIDENGFIEMVKEGTKKSIQDAIESATHSWHFKSKIQQAITDRLDSKISEYAESVANKVLKDL